MTHSTSTWIVNQNDNRPLPDENGHHVMAWARDSETGEPVYILELDKTRRGAKCGCECPSCNLPLQAVNAAKAKYKKRPHFRHPEGAPKSECMFLSARLAAIQLLRDHGVIQLPRRTMRGQVIGLSGVVHEAWIERPPQTVAIRNFNFRDRAAAILTLEDGRELRVLLIGSGSTADIQVTDGNPIPTIWLNLQDDSLASMSPEALKSRLTLVPDSVCWLSHWEDKELLASAQEAASEIAENFMDLVGEYEQELAGVEGKFRRETLLHLEVKRILAESKEIKVPELHARSDSFFQEKFGIELEWGRPAEIISLLDVQLEKRLGRVIPDVIAKIAEDRGGFMMIEVTVTNQIDTDRRIRISEQFIPALEIDLSGTGGLISRAELKELVIYGLKTKKWLHHPELNFQTDRINAEAEDEASKLKERLKQEEKYRATILAINLKTIASEYLDWIFKYAEFDQEESLSDKQKTDRALCFQKIKELAKQLAVHEFPEAESDELFHGRQGIIPRILSIKVGHGVGYNLDSTMAVMNAIKQSGERNRTNHSIYLIAEKIYRSNREPIKSWYQSWAKEVRDGIKSQKSEYIRDERYDKLLSMLFPEMAESIKGGFGTRRWRQNKSEAAKKPRSSNPTTPPLLNSLGTDYKNLWFTGEYLERWKRENPASVEIYMSSFKPRK